MQYRTISDFIFKKIHFKKTFQQKVSSIFQIYHIHQQHRKEIFLSLSFPVSHILQVKASRLSLCSKFLSKTNEYFSSLTTPNMKNIEVN